ncbi:MAG: phosphoribosylanthranilate isomerase [Melioribacteraceae bacterium]|nr:phosphoribosylanthranilate isomerase [Melioribacteraceae bacterium]
MISKKTRVKICCISSAEEAKMAINAGASLLGLVSEMPSGPGIIDETLITEIAETVPPGIGTVVLTSKIKADEIIEQQKKCKVNTIQLVDVLPDGEHEKLKSALPGISIIQVIHVRDESSIDECIKLSQFIDAFLLDSGNPDLEVKVLGGTGKTHNWEISKKIVKAVEVPVFLAGGLRPDNVQDAIRKVRPYGVDLCSGIRTDGNLDFEKLSQFMINVENVI